MFKNISWLSKIILFVNLVLAFITLFAYLLPYLAPKWFPFLSVLTLVLPVLIILNFLFFSFWLIQLKKFIVVSGIVLLLGITFINKFYNLSSKNLSVETSDFTVMSYNVRLFNRFNWFQKTKIPEKIAEFILEKNPDLLCIQEYSQFEATKFKQYKYNYIFKEGKNIIVGNAIFSKYKILNKGVINFPESNNNAVFADILKENDTLRVYSMHLESIKISTEIEDDDIKKMDESKSKQIYNRLSLAFKKQQDQALLIKQHYTNCKYKKIICGDLNNSAFSFVYRTVKGNLEDGFENAGSGFGKTYNFKYYPPRIDYIFADKKLKIKNFETFNNFFNSDHYPIFIRLNIHKKS